MSQQYCDPRHLFYIWGYNDIDDNVNDDDSDKSGNNDNKDDKLITTMSPVLDQL